MNKEQWILFTIGIIFLILFIFALDSTLNTYGIIVLWFASSFFITSIIALMLKGIEPRKRDGVVRHPKNNDYAMLVNQSYKWEQPHWVLANTGSLDALMLTLMMGSQYMQDGQDMKIIKTENVEQFLEENNEK